MNEIKKCSISGVGFTLESAAYNSLNNYLNSLREAYRDNPDSEEILADIEARIAELILSAHSNTETIISLPIIENIIKQLGSPEDISGKEQSAPKNEESRIPRRLHRDLENAKLGGVCAGLAKYFGVDAVWVRLLLFSPLFLLFFSGIPFMWWCGPLGGNLFGIFLLTYIILWFAIPAAKSARQKLEMEGKPISAQTIADNQGSTQEEQAKSSVASAVTVFGQISVVVMKIFLGFLLFPIMGVILSMLIAIVAIIFGAGELVSLNIGNFDSLSQIISDSGVSVLIFSILLILIPAIYLAYLFITLLLNKRPRWWVLLVSILAWIMMLLGTIISGIGIAEDKLFTVFSTEDEVERIMKKSENKTTLSRQIMESLDEEPDAEQKADIERLQNDPQATSIDK